MDRRNKSDNENKNLYKSNNKTRSNANNSLNNNKRSNYNNNSNSNTNNFSKYNRIRNNTSYSNNKGGNNSDNKGNFVPKYNNISNNNNASYNNNYSNNKNKVKQEFLNNKRDKSNYNSSNNGNKNAPNYYNNSKDHEIDNIAYHKNNNNLSNINYNQSKNNGLTKKNRNNNSNNNSNSINNNNINNNSNTSINFKSSNKQNKNDLNLLEKEISSESDSCNKRKIKSKSKKNSRKNSKKKSNDEFLKINEEFLASEEESFDIKKKNKNPFDKFEEIKYNKTNIEAILKEDDGDQSSSYTPKKTNRKTTEEIDSELLATSESNEEEADKDSFVISGILNNNSGVSEISNVLAKNSNKDSVSVINLLNNSSDIKNKNDSKKDSIKNSSNATNTQNKLIESSDSENDFIAFTEQDNQFMNDEQKNYLKISDSNKNIPWMTEEIRNARGFNKLHLEIIAFTKLIEPTKQENQLREDSIKMVKNAIKEEYPTWTIKAFGSYPVQLHLPDSDVDLVVIVPEEEFVNEEQIFNKLENILISEKLVSYCRYIKAKVPILKSIIKKTEINVDITVNRSNGYKTKEDVKKILEKLPSLRKLIYVLKYYLRQKNLNDTYSGGVSSFLIFNLCYAFFNYYVSKVYTSENPYDITLAHLLVDFFNFYGNQFSYDKLGISIRNGCFFFERNDSNIDRRKRPFLCVENYQDVSQDIGKGSFKFKQVYDTFKHAREKLLFPDEVKESFLDKIINIDHFLVERAKNINFKEKYSERCYNESDEENQN